MHCDNVLAQLGEYLATSKDWTTACLSVALSLFGPDPYSDADKHAIGKSEWIYLNIK